MELVIGMNGGVRCTYDEALELRALAKLLITPGEPRGAGLGLQLVGRHGASWGGGVGAVHEPDGGVGVG
jgi:hypothetical protein